MPATNGIFEIPVPVYVHIENGRVVRVTVDDQTQLGAARHVEGDALPALIAAADASDWPAWEIGE